MIGCSVFGEKEREDDFWMGEKGRWSASDRCFCFVGSGGDDLGVVGWDGLGILGCWNLGGFLGDPYLFW